MQEFTPDRPEFFLGDPHAAFRRIRREDPLHWYESGRFWCVTKHADVQEISRLPRIFSSAHGTQLFEIPLQHLGEWAGGGGAQSIIRMDPPEHNRHRKSVMPIFTPQAIAKLEPRIRQIARESIDCIAPGEVMDFVETVAIPTPMFVIAEMLGVPTSDWGEFRRWSDAMIEIGSSGGAGQGGVAQAMKISGELFAYFSQRLAERRARPGDDLLSILLAAEVDGKKLSEPEILIFCLTLLVAGNETTRSLIAVGTQALLEHPEQLARLAADPSKLPNAIEEMLRWVTPIQSFVRRALQDTELRGKRIAAGDFLALFYGSANRDEEVFGDDAGCFDIERSRPDRHVAFGFGEHLCMGASLARLEANIVFGELLARYPRIEAAGSAERVPSVLANSLARMPVVFHAGSRR